MTSTDDCMVTFLAPSLSATTTAVTASLLGSLWGVTLESGTAVWSSGVVASLLGSGAWLCVWGPHAQAQALAAARPSGWQQRSHEIVKLADPDDAAEVALLPAHQQAYVGARP